MVNIPIQTNSREQLLDITTKVQEIVSASKIKDGVCHLQSLHTTAGLTINENADPDVKADILKGLKIFDNNNYQHSEGNSPAHIKTSLMGPSLSIIIQDGKLIHLSSCLPSNKRYNMLESQRARRRLSGY